MSRYFTATGFILLLFVVACAMAKPTDRYEEVTGEEDDFDVIEKPWQESAVQVPELPEDDGWVTFSVDSLPSTQKLALSKNNITIDRKDWVVRYWVRISSTGGASNTAYQGVRCRTREFVTYAYGHKHRDPAVTLVKRPKWTEIGLRRKGNYTEELARYIFCSGEVPRKPREMEQAIDGKFELMNPYQDYFDDY